MGISGWLLGGANTPRIVNLGGVEMVYLKGGTFQMGSPNSEEKRGSDEGPVHEVELDGFYIGRFLVTQEQYQVIMGTNPSNFKGSKDPVEQISWDDAKQKYQVIKGLPRNFKDLTHPVEQVSWDDAKAFCQRLSQKTGKIFRLPTEAEWEYACRAGSRTSFCFGDSDNGLGDYAWYGGNSGQQTHPVGQKKANAWGVYDMHGNVWEWCEDWYDRDYYGSSPRKNPTGPSSGQDRVLRGGSWCDFPWNCRSADRPYFAEYVTHWSGFRVVCVSGGPSEPCIRQAAPA